MMVFLIMAGMTPNFYFFMHGTHVHHLNYGIFLLCLSGGYGIFRRPTGLAAEITAFIYGIGLGLTFDEFGMWLHLGGSYWQRVSIDAVVIVGCSIALVGYVNTIKKWESRHTAAFFILLVLFVSFARVLWVVGDKLGSMVGPTLEQLEISSSP